MEQASFDHAFDFDLLEFPSIDFTGAILDPLIDLPVPTPANLLNHFVPNVSPNSRITLDILNPEGQKCSPPTDQSAQTSCSRASDSSDDSSYADAVANLHIYDPDNANTIQFPSKRILYRFVDAYFMHMAPHMPILHQPTFTIASTPCKYVFECDEKY